MKINCQIAGDLMVPYLDGTCSEDSKKSLEAHIAGCDACRERLARMSGSTPNTTPDSEAVKLTGYARRVKKRRAVIAAVAILVFLAAAGFFVHTVVNLALKDMEAREHPHLFSQPPTEDTDPNTDHSNYQWDPTEWEGVTDLTAGPLETTAGEVNSYTLFTNSTVIKVTVDGVEAVMRLSHADDETNLTLQSHRGTVTVFVGLSASYHYRVTVEAPPETPVTVSDGYDTPVTFENSLKYILHELFGIGRDPYVLG